MPLTRKPTVLHSHAFLTPLGLWDPTQGTCSTCMVLLPNWRSSTLCWPLSPLPHVCSPYFAYALTPPPGLSAGWSTISLWHGQKPIMGTLPKWMFFPTYLAFDTCTSYLILWLPSLHSPHPGCALTHCILPWQSVFTQALVGCLSDLALTQALDWILQGNEGSRKEVLWT